MNNVDRLFEELDKRGLKNVERAYHQNNEWLHDSLEGTRVGGWIALKKSNHTEILSYVAIGIALAGLVF